METKGPEKLKAQLYRRNIGGSDVLLHIDLDAPDKSALEDGFYQYWEENPGRVSLMLYGTP